MVGPVIAAERHYIVGGMLVPLRVEGRLQAVVKSAARELVVAADGAEAEATGGVKVLVVRNNDRGRVDALSLERVAGTA